MVLFKMYIHIALAYKLEVRHRVKKTGFFRSVILADGGLVAKGKHESLVC